MHETPNKYACYSQVSFSNLKRKQIEFLQAFGLVVI